MTDDLVVTFVCTANICRSAYAQVRARTMLGEGSGVRIQSAGTYGHTGEGIDNDMGALASARGSDPSSFVASRVTRDTINESDLVLTAETTHRSFVLEEWPAAFRKVFTFSQFAEAIADADPSLSGRELIAWAQTRRTPARPAGNIADPYRRGPELSEVCADQIDGLLEAILPRLVGAR